MRQDRRQVDFGSFQVHKKVFAQIIAEAMSNVEGASLPQADGWAKWISFFDQENIAGIDVDLDEQDNVSISVSILVRSGFSIPDLSRMVQNNIRTSVERMINVNLKEISVIVVGLERRYHEIP